MSSKNGPPRGVSSLPSGRGGRLRSRPPVRGRGDEIFKIYLLMREKEREIQFRNALSRSLRRNWNNEKQIDRRLDSLLGEKQIVDLFGPPVEASERPEQGAGPSKPTRLQADEDTRSGHGEFQRTVIEY